MKSPKFEQLLQTMLAIHDSKNADYATDGNPYSNFEEAAAAAGVSVDQVFAVLMGIKQARLKALTGRPPQNEPVQDSLLDLAVYAALRASYGGTKPSPSREEESVKHFHGYLPPFTKQGGTDA